MSGEQGFYNVIIIGAGMAGISTAYHLICESNFEGKVIILEARNRIGGRILKETIASEKVEIGANWIHGIINNPIYNLALKYKLIDPLKDKPKEFPYGYKNFCGYTSKGEKIPISIIENVCQIYFWILKKCSDFYFKIFKYGLIANVEEYDDSVYKFIMAEINNYLLTRSEEEKKLILTILNQLLNREKCINGCNSIDDLSLKYYGAYEELPGGNLTIPSGFIEILNGLLNEIREKIKDKTDYSFDIFLNNEVEIIKWCGVEASTNNPTEVICTNGKIYKCNQVVNTMPIGVLKEKISALYEPKIPQYKIDCINKIGFNFVNKIFLEYENPIIPEFIDKKVSEIMCFWSDNDLKDKIENDWYKKIYSFDLISDKLLLGWISGSEAKYIESLDTKVIEQVLTEKIRLLLNKNDFPYPKSVTISRWGTDKFTKGAYTFIRKNSTIKDLELISQPIYCEPGNDKVKVVIMLSK